MPSKHQTPVLGWRPANARDVARLRARAAKQGRGAIGRMLDEALAAYLAEEAAGERCWGMVWVLADMAAALAENKSTREEWVRWAQADYERGLQMAVLAAAGASAAHETSQSLPGTSGEGL